MIKTVFHPEFQKALDLGHVVPALLPDGSPFIIDGVQFYQASDDGVNMYQGRMMSFTDVIEKHDRLKLDEATIRAFFVSVSESVTQAMLQFNTDPEQAMAYLADISRLAQFGKQRLDLYEDVSTLQIGSNTARVYELSSIWFFASDEDPASYDPTKGRRNVQLMLSNPHLYDFFLRLRLNRFAPLAAHSEENILKSMKALRENDFQALLLFTQTHLRLKTDGVKATSIHFLESLRQTLTAYDSCYDQLLRNLTNTWPHLSA
ncbi:hypothetical protein BH09BAC4_BH09BAC4_28200 [soil metagenome]